MSHSPLTLIHALALGISTIASRTGGNPEIVEHGRNGLLFDKADAGHLAASICQLASDGALRARLAGDARRTASQFTFERMVARMADVLTLR